MTNTTAVILWNTTSVRSLSYDISLSSSCPTGTRLIPDVNSTQYMIGNLCPGTTYTLAIRVTDTQVNKISLFSEVSVFVTLSGTPTIPRFVNGMIDQNEKKLFITWVTPQQTYGVIDHYEVQWSLTTKQCDQNDRGADIMGGNTTDATTFRYDVDLVNLNFKSYSVCVRAVTTSNTKSSWGKHFNNDVMQAGLLQTEETCNTLTAVACVAALTVVSSLIMSVILSISIAQKGWFCFKNEVHGEKHSTYPQ